MRCTFSLRTWTGLLAIVGGLVRFAAPAAAQQQTLPGRVLDPAEQPVAGIEVFLHRVTEQGAGIVATDTTDAEGAFALSAQADSSEAIFFVAARYEGQLNIGMMLRSPFPQLEYVLRVGVNPVAVDPNAGVTTPAAAESDDRRAITLIVMGALLAFAAFAMYRAAQPPTSRRLLLRLAELEESRDESGRLSPDGETERGRILARLRFGRAT